MPSRNKRRQCEKELRTFYERVTGSTSMTPDYNVTANAINEEDDDISGYDAHTSVPEDAFINADLPTDENTNANVDEEKVAAKSPVAINAEAGIGARFFILKQAAQRKGLDSEDTSLFFISELISEVHQLKTEVGELKAEMTILRGQTLSTVGSQSSQSLTIPVFKTEEEYGDVENHPRELLSWMKRQGGSDLRDHIRRVLGNMFSVDLQRQINRTGSHKKLALHNYLERHLKQSSATLFPKSTDKDVEISIMKFLKGASDRAGGRSDRRTTQSSKRNLEADDDEIMPTPQKMNRCSTLVSSSDSD